MALRLPCVYQWREAAKCSSFACDFWLKGMLFRALYASGFPQSIKHLPSAAKPIYSGDRAVALELIYLVCGEGGFLSRYRRYSVTVFQPRRLRSR